MDLRQFSYFIEVAKQRSFSKAGQQLHISQPTLSKMLKNLEEELGMTLVDRSTRRVQLTEAGEIFQSYAEQVLQSLEDLRAALADVSNMRRGKIRLGLPPVIGASFFPKVIAQFHEVHPHIEIDLVEEGGKMVEQSVLAGTVDVGVGVLPIDEASFDVVELVQRELKLVLHVDHPLANRPEVELTDLRDEPFIMFRQGFHLYDRVRETCIREGFEPTVTYESSQWDFIGELVAANHGIAFLPETVCNKLTRDEVQIVPVTRPSIRWNLGLIWAKDRYLSVAARAFIAFIEGVFRAEASTEQIFKRK